MDKAYFKLHDFLCFSIEGEGSRLAKFIKEFEFYRVTEPVQSPDVAIVLADFRYHPGKNARTVNKKFIVDDDAVFAEDGYKVARWKVRISGLESETTTVQLYGNKPTNIIAARWFCETIIRLKMTLAGFPMVHSSCLCDGKRGAVMAASPSTGKTTTLLSWLEKGNPFCCDEYSILDQGKVHSYVTPFRFHAHNLDMNPMLERLPERDRRQIRMRTALLKATGGYADVTWDIGIGTAFPDVAVVDHCETAGLFVLTRAEVDHVTFVERSTEELVRMMQTINSFEWRGFEPYMRAWSYGHPGGRIAEFSKIEHDHMLRIAENTRVGEILIPSTFRSTTYNELIEVLGV